MFPRVYYKRAFMNLIHCNRNYRYYSIIAQYKANHKSLHLSAKSAYCIRFCLHCLPTCKICSFRNSLFTHEATIGIVSREFQLNALPLEVRSASCVHSLDGGQACFPCASRVIDLAQKSFHSTLPKNGMLGIKNLSRESKYGVMVKNIY